jgi:hypothetical protein
MKYHVLIALRVPVSPLSPSHAKKAIGMASPLSKVGRQIPLFPPNPVLAGGPVDGVDGPQTRRGLCAWRRLEGRTAHRGPLTSAELKAIRARLEACLPDVPNAMSCYEQTLWAASFFASKRGGVGLERALRGYPAPFEPLIGEVYRSDKDEYAFRRDWFIDCTL